MAKNTKEVTCLSGDLPSQDVKNFDKILQLVIDNWDLTKPVDLMMASRMVSCFMKLRYAEGKAEELGLLLEVPGGSAKLNPLLSYSRDLQNDLMRFYRLFQSKNPEIADGPANFSEWIDDNTKKTKQK